MTARRIADIIQTLTRAKASGARLNGKSALERELQAWIDKPTIQVPPVTSGYPSIDAPEPFDDYSLETWQKLCAKYRGYIRVS